LKLPSLNLKCLFASVTNLGAELIFLSSNYEVALDTPSSNNKVAYFI